MNTAKSFLYKPIQKLIVNRTHAQAGKPPLVWKLSTRFGAVDSILSAVGVTTLAEKTAVTFLDTIYGHGIDVSYYQGTMNFAVAYLWGDRFTYIRSHVGWYRDVNFGFNWQNARANDLITIPYCVFNPLNDGWGNAVWWVNDLIESYGVNVEKHPIVIDAELTLGCTPQRITNHLANACNAIHELSGNWPIIYTGAWWWNVNVLDNPLWHDLKFIFASYTAEPVIPIWFSPANRIAWQYTSSLPGSEHGASSTYIDGNHILIPMGELRQLCGYKEEATEIPPVEIPPGITPIKPPVPVYSIS